MGPNVRCLACGIDILVLNVSYADEGGQPVKQELAEGLQTELDTWQQTAKGRGEPVPTPWMFAGANLLIREHGTREQWRWLLYSDKLTLRTLDRLSWLAE
jgi:hypothetical protein